MTFQLSRMSDRDLLTVSVGLRYCSWRPERFAWYRTETDDPAAGVVCVTAEGLV